MSIPMECRKVIVSLALFAVAGLGIAQQATIQNSGELRKSANTDREVTGALNSGAAVSLASPQENAGHSQAGKGDGEIAWVSARDVQDSGTPATAARKKPVHPGGAATFTQLCSTPAFPAGATPMDTASCGLEGAGGKEGAQNAAKNNFCATGTPRPVAIDDLVGLQQQVESNPSIPFGKGAGRPDGPATDRSPLQAIGEGTQVVLTGFVKVARQEGAESVNCEENVPNMPAYHDIHIAIVGQPGDTECSGVVAEMVPHHRPASWTPEVLNQVAKSKLPVRLTGDLLFDSSHAPCKNGVPNSGDPSRISLWEVHPIYKFEVCTQSDCSSGTGWVTLESWRKP